MPDRKLKHSNRPIRKAIKDLLEPEIAALGFFGKYPEWRREPRGEIHFIAVQADKYGGGFFVNGAWAKRVAGISWDDRSLAHTDFDDRMRLTAPTDLWNVDGTRLPYRLGYFDYRHMLDSEKQCRELVQSAVDGLPSLDHWLRTREADEKLTGVSALIGSAPNRELVWKIAQAKAQMGLY